MNGQPDDVLPNRSRGYGEPLWHPASEPQATDAGSLEALDVQVSSPRESEEGACDEPPFLEDGDSDEGRAATCAPPSAEARIAPGGAPAILPPPASERRNRMSAAGPEKMRRWPWVLLGGALGTLFGAGVCIVCASFAVIGLFQQIHGAFPDGSSEGQPPEQGSPYDWSYPYGHDFLNGGAEDSGDVTQVPFTYEEIVSALPAGPGFAEVSPETGVLSCSAGAYQVGTLSGIPEGVYLLEGAPDKESRYFLFEAVSGRADPQKARYLYQSQNAYLGDHFVSLSDGDLIVYLPADDEDLMYDASAAPAHTQEVLSSGMYRVGVDVPAGTYRIERDEGLVDVTSLEPGAYVMSASSFAEGTVVDERYVALGSNQTVDVRNGDWLELYGATAVLEGEPEP